MVQSQQTKRNALHELGYKIFLDRYAQKDMTRESLAVGDTVIVVVNAATGQREIGKVTAMALPQVTIELLDGTVVTRDVEHVDKPIETDPAQMMDRVAAGIAELEPEAQRKEWTERFRWLLDDWKFVPGGRILTAAGTDQQLSYYNCYVLKLPNDSRGGILKTLGEMTEIMSRGGGVGITLSSLRPRHAYVKGVNGRSSGSVSWGALYSFVTGLIEQGGCFGPDERIATSSGLVPAAELAARIEAGETFYAQTHRGLRKITARFRNGVKPLFEVTTRRGYKVRITEDHKVAVLMDGRITTMPLKYLREGDEILLLLGRGVQTTYQPLKPLVYERSIMSTTLNEEVRLPEILDEDLAYLIGYMHGDGYVQMGKKVNWQAPKAVKMATADAYPEIRERIIDAVQRVFGLGVSVYPGDGAHHEVTLHSRLVIEWLILNGLLKAKADAVRVPEAIFRSPSAVVAAFIAGYFDADGCNRGRKGGYGMDSISREMLEDVQQLLAANGILSHIQTTDRSAQGWQTIYRLIISGAEFKRRFAAFVPTAKASPDANGRRDMYNTYPAAVWRNLGARTKYRQRIYDGVSERISYGQLSSIHTRLLEGGDSAHAAELESMLSAVPDEIASIVPLAESEVFDFEVDDVHLLSGNGIYTSNSRRGALMLLLSDWHPDVIEFIKSKRTAGQITNANISVAISDAFMEAVKSDGDWQLRFPDTTTPDYDEFWDGDIEKWEAAGGKVHVYRTMKARELWHTIIESAWASAEPGLLFIDRYNKMSNSWYHSRIVGVNPCVTGDTLIYTNKGMRRAIDLFNDETDIEVVIDGRFGLTNTTTPSTRVFRTGHKAVYRLQTREGYYVRATADHRFMTPRGWVELRDLQPGDQVHILNRKGGFGTAGSLEEGRVLGWYVGDGHLNEQNGVVLSFFGAEKAQLAPFFASYVNELVEPATVMQRSYPVGVSVIAERDEARVSSKRLMRIVERYGLVENKFRVPECVYGGSEEIQRGFLQALFTADGGFQDGGEKGGSIRLASSHLELLEGVQQLLANFGIVSRIYRERREAGYRLLPDSNRDAKPYGCEAQHELVISKQNMVVFADELGFLADDKQNALRGFVTRGKRGPYRENFLATVEHVEYAGEEDVFDLTEPITHSMIVNGISCHQCGEQGLPGDGVCNLGAINLAKFYDAEKHDVAWDDLKQAVRYAVRFLDNVIDANYYFRDENRDQQLAERRVGLGTMGIAELMIRLGVRYGDDESVQFIDRLYGMITTAAYETSAEIAAEKGAFPRFDAEKFLESGFMQTMPDWLRQKVAANGIRNVTLLTQAPTGCVAPDTLVSTATGMQPIAALGDPNGPQWQELLRDVHTDVGLRRTSHFYVNGYQPVKTVTTARGFSITATHNHRLRVLDGDGNYVWRRMDALQPGDQVVLKKNTLGVGETVALTPVEQGNRALSALPAAMTPEFAELLGLYMGDGYTKRRGGLHIVVTQKDPDLLDHVRGLMQSVWGERQVTAEERIGCWTLNLTGYYISRFFAVNGLQKPDGNHGEGAAGAFIPTKVLQAGRAAVAAFLRGLFEADGSVTRGSITLVSTSRQLVQQAQVALLGLGIVATMRQMPAEGKRYGTRALYELRMLNRREAEKFVAQVGFISERKRQKANALGNMSARGDSIAVQPLLEEFYRQSAGAVDYRVRQQINGLVRNGALTQQSVQRLVSAHPVLESTRLAQLVSMEVFVDTVAVIEEGTCHTYDISVPENHTYIANGFVSHNTTGTLVNTSTGIEPFFSWVYYRKSRLGLHEEKVPVVQEWLNAHPDQAELPPHFVTAMELSPDDHVKVQAAFQRWIDSSISKTTNCPNDWTVEQVAKLYEHMYDLGCKGGTIYRDGSREEQVLMLKGDERAEKEMEQKEALKQESAPVPVPQPEVKTVTADAVIAQSTPYHVYPRPAKLQGVTVSRKTPFGTAYITMNSDEHGYPFEVFITVGKAGSDLQADAESLGRLISLSLRTTAPEKRLDMMKLIIDQLQGIGGARQMGFGAGRMISLPDSLARALEEQYFPRNEPQQLGLPIDNGGIKAPPAAKPPTLHSGPAGVISGADLCPSCGTISLVKAEGCRKCLTCDYTEC